MGCCGWLVSLRVLSGLFAALCVCCGGLLAGRILWSEARDAHETLGTHAQRTHNRHIADSIAQTLHTATAAAALSQHLHNDSTPERFHSGLLDAHPHIFASGHFHSGTNASYYIVRRNETPHSTYIHDHCGLDDCSATDDTGHYVEERREQLVYPDGVQGVWGLIEKGQCSFVSKLRAGVWDYKEIRFGTMRGLLAEGLLGVPGARGYLQDDTGQVVLAVEGAHQGGCVFADPVLRAACAEGDDVLRVEGEGYRRMCSTAYNSRGMALYVCTVVPERWHGGEVQTAVVATLCAAGVFWMIAFAAAVLATRHLLCVADVLQRCAVLDVDSHLPTSLSPLFEVRMVQLSTQLLITSLSAYRAFVPAVVQTGSEESDVSSASTQSGTMTCDVRLARQCLARTKVDLASCKATVLVARVGAASEAQDPIYVAEGHAKLAAMIDACLVSPAESTLALGAMMLSFSCRSHQDHAVSLAKQLEAQQGAASLAVHIGIASGLVFSGVMGSARQKGFSIHGRTVNEAHALSLCRGVGCDILCGPLRMSNSEWMMLELAPVFLAVRGGVAFTPIATTDTAGDWLAGHDAEGQTSAIAQYTRALHCVRDGEDAEATSLLQDCVQSTSFHNEASCVATVLLEHLLGCNVRDNPEDATYYLWSGHKSMRPEWSVSVSSTSIVSRV